MRKMTALAAMFLMTAGFALGEEAATDVGTNWHQWRGPLGTGVAPEANPPATWSATENMRWSVEIPGLGFSSPIIWNDRIFITTSIAVENPAEAAEEGAQGGRRRGGMLGSRNPTVAQRLVLMCIDRASGKVIWERDAHESVPHEGHHGWLSSHANETPVTDGEHVYAFYGSEGLFCYDMDGNLKWQKDFGVKMRVFNRFGESASPALHGDTIVVLFDHDEQSFVAAVDKNSGDIRWRVDREEDTTWTSPYIYEHEGNAQVAVSAGNFVRGYDLSSGDLIWQSSGMTRGVIPTPVYGDGMLFASSGTLGHGMIALRLGETGDLTGTDSVIWSLDKFTPYNSSPLLWGEEIYVLEDMQSGNTFISCFDAKTGKAHYTKQRLPKNYTIKSSAIGAGDKIYMCSEEGEVLVMARGTEFKLLATNVMDELFLATPAAAGGDLILRSQNHLYCVSEN